MKVHVKAGYPDSSILAPTYKLILELEHNQTVADLKNEITVALRAQLGEQCTIGTPNELILLECGRRLKNEHELSKLLWGNNESAPIRVVLPKIKPSERFTKKPVSTFFENSTFADLNQVGITKSLGYLSQNTLTVGGYSTNELQNEFSRRGINSYFNDNFLYAYDKESCEQFLKENQVSLDGWPVDADQFVKRLSQEQVSQQLQPKLFEIIHHLFVNYEGVKSRSELTC